MMILDDVQFREQLKAFVGDDNSQETLTFVENMTDTFNDLSSRVASSDDLIPRTELDRVNEEWAKKYKERFFEGGATFNPNSKPKIEENKKEYENLQFENLFEVS